MADPDLGDPDFLALSVVDAQTGQVLWRANLTPRGATGNGQAVGLYPCGDVPNGGGDPQPVTFPAFDGTGCRATSLTCSRTSTTMTSRRPKDEMPAVTGALDWSFYLPSTTPRTRRRTARPHFDLHVGQDRPDRTGTGTGSWFGVQLFYFLNTFHDHLLAAPIGFTEAAGNFQLDEHDRPGRRRRRRRRVIHRRREHRARVPRRRPRQQRELVDAARRRARPSCRCTCPRGDWGRELPVRRRRRRRRRSSTTSSPTG